MATIAGPGGILVRVLSVALLVSGTYNPSGYSYYHWVFHGGADHWASKAVVGQIIVVAFIFCGNTAARSLGLLLSVPLLLVIGTGIWLLSEWRVVDLSSGLQRTLVFEVVIVLLLGAGVSLSLIRYRLSGQLDSRPLN
jgi:hypothetical protein